MSRPYRLLPPPPQPVRATVTSRAESNVTSQDAVVTKIDLAVVLPKAAMKEIVKDVAVQEGWTPGCKPDELHKDTDQVEQTLDLEAMTVTVVAKGSAKIEKSVKAQVSALPSQLKEAVQAAQETLEEKVEADVKAAAKEKQVELDKAVLDSLTGVAESLKKNLNELVSKVYVEALKKKAASLGQITSVKEGRDENGNMDLTIKVTE